MNTNLRTVLHVDLNNFYASVECLYRPELRQVPVAVCGDPEDRRGIVLAKNMPAKLLGIKTGEAIWQAREKAANLVLVPPDYSKYLRFSKMAKAIYADYTDQIEPFGIDECWLDISGSVALFGSGREVADTIRRRVKDEMGVTVSVGVSFNKIFAKLGSDLKKPDATTVIGVNDYQQLVWPLPVGDLLYVGRSTQKKLRELSITTIGDLATADLSLLTQKLGKWGEVLWLFARGKDTAPVKKYGYTNPVKSIGNSTTCPRDLVNKEDVLLVFTVLAESVAERLRGYGLKASGVQIYLRDNELFSITRQIPLRTPTCISTVLLQAAMELFQESYTWKKPLRSIGLRAINLVTAHDYIQLSLFDKEAEEMLAQEAIENVVDSLRSRFGHGSVLRASCLLDSRLTGFNPKEDHVIHPVSYFR